MATERRVRARRLRAALALTLVAGALGCDRSPGAEPVSAGRRLAVTVAPLHLAGVTEAVYGLTVTNGAGQTVWSASDLRSSRYGDGAGALSYVGSCDAESNPNRVTLTLSRLEGPGGQDLAGTWRNPTPVSVDATCVDDTDTPVVFDLTIARDADQGFFDVAVSFDGVYCAAKLDCQNELLHGPDGERGLTLVVAFACTAGPGRATFLHMTDLLVECDAGTSWINTASPPGNAGPAGPFFQTAVFRGDEQFLGQDIDKCYWNTALGISEGAGAANCHLHATATASPEAWPTGESPPGTTFPYVAWDVPLTNAAGQVICSQHPLDGAPVGVATRYTSLAGATFTHEIACGALPTDPGQFQCGAVTLANASTDVAVLATADGMSVTVGGQRSANYRLPEGYQLLSDCCAASCCPAP